MPKSAKNTEQTPPQAPVKRPRGRPARISEAAIIEKTMELLGTRDADDISMALIAESLGIPTMSLYNYFPNHAALMNAVADYAFSLFKFPDSELRKPWREAIMAWLWAVQDHFDSHPLAIKILMVEGQSTLAWIKAMNQLLQVFKSTGLKDEKLTFAFCWFTSQAVGVMAIEDTAHDSRQVYGQRDVFEGLTDEEQEDQRVLKKYLLKIRRDDVLQFSFEAMIEALEKLLPSPG